MVALFVGKALCVSLDDRFSAFPKSRTQRMESVAALLCLHPLQVLENIDRLNLFEILRQPFDAAFWLALPKILDLLGAAGLTPVTVTGLLG